MDSRVRNLPHSYWIVSGRMRNYHGLGSRITIFMYGQAEEALVNSDVKAMRRRLRHPAASLLRQ
jgi:hypothetical protein